MADNRGSREGPRHAARPRNREAARKPFRRTGEKLALTRKMLKAMGIEDEKIDQIIEEHVESIDGLKAERDRYKTGAEEAEGLRKQLEEAKAAGEGAGEY